MALLMEQAGGMALTGKTRILDLVPQKVMTQTPQPSTLNPKP